MRVERLRHLLYPSNVTCVVLWTTSELPTLLQQTVIIDLLSWRLKVCEGEEYFILARSDSRPGDRVVGFKVSAGRKLGEYTSASPRWRLSVFCKLVIGWCR
jgi:hypothetical protein